MSALAGVFERTGGVGRGDELAATARAMLEAQAARGPDARGVWSSGEVALGHGLLRATAEDDFGPQPFCSADGAIVVAFDGRLDGRDEIDGAARHATDAELGARAYARWGLDFAAHL